MECKTLLEIVEETQFHVKALNSESFAYSNQNKETSKLKFGDDLETSTTSETDNECSNGTEEYVVVDIRSKTGEEERRWMKEDVKKLRRNSAIKAGESLRGTTVENISSSIPFSHPIKTSCTLKLSNCLNIALTDRECYFFEDSRNSSGPSTVCGNTNEVFTFVGSWNCHFLCSFTVNRLLRLTILCCSASNGKILFGIGFTPADILINDGLYAALSEMSPIPDVWMNIDTLINNPLELVVAHGTLLATGRMSNGPRSVVQVEICETTGIKSLPTLSRPQKKYRVVNGISMSPKLLTTNPKRFVPQKPSCTTLSKNSFSCNVEIVNFLAVTLKNKNKFYCNSENKCDFPSEVLPLQRERFFAADYRNMDVMFSYEIVSKDLVIVVALKVQRFFNTFAAAFVPFPIVTDSKELEAFMDPNHWDKYFYRKLVAANEGVQLIQTRNIRAEIKMTDEEQSILKIRIFAV